MEYKEALKEAQNEVLRKIGRNVILFQRLEQLLKRIVAEGKISGCATELKILQAKRTAIINKQTMGLLVGQYIEQSNPGCKEEYPSAPEELKDAFISFGFQTECDSFYYENKKKSLARMVSERNELIHNNLQPDFASTISCEELGNKLDDQSENILCEIKELETKLTTLNELKKLMVNFIKSEEGKKFLFGETNKMSKILRLIS